MLKRRQFFLCLFSTMLIFFFLNPSVFSCTAGMRRLSNKSSGVVYTLDFSGAGRGKLWVLPRDIEKTSLKHGLSVKGLKSVRWKSILGSVVISPGSLLTPMFGVNEKGLTVGVLLNNGRATPAKTKSKIPFLKDLQVASYLLDQAQSIEDVVRLLSNIQILEEGFYALHFFVCTPRTCAVLEPQSDGSVKIYRGRSLPYMALANEPYLQSKKLVRDGTEHGLSRFTKAAILLGTKVEIAENNFVDLGHSFLEFLSGPSTQWGAIVLSRSSDTILVVRMKDKDGSTWGNPQTLYLSQLIFKPGAKIMVLDLDSGFPLAANHPLDGTLGPWKPDSDKRPLDVQELKAAEETLDGKNEKK